MLSFEDFSGQSAHIAQLHADFANHTFVHAYLLCGPRGTGKKSVARLCAMAPDARRVDFPESKHEIYRGEDATVQRWMQTVLDFLPA